MSHDDTSRPNTPNDPDTPDTSHARARPESSRATALGAAPHQLSLLHSYQAIIEGASVVILLANAEGRLLCVNRRAKTLFGFTDEELEGQSLDMLIPEWFTHGARLLQGALSPADRLPHVAEELFGRRQDGSEFRIHLIASVLTGAMPTLVALAIYAPRPWGPDLGVTRDIFDQQEGKTTHRLAQALALVELRLAAERQNQSLRKRADKALEDTRATAEQMRALQAVTDTALAHLDLDALLPALLDRVRDALKVDNALVVLLDVEGRGEGSGDGDEQPHAIVRAARGPQAKAAIDTRIPPGERFVGRTVATGRPQIATDLSQYPKMKAWLQEQASSAVGAPLLLRDQVMGVLCVTTAEPRQFTSQDVMLLQRVAERVTLAIERGQRYEMERQARSEAEAARIEAQAARVEAVRQAQRLDRVVEAMGEALLVYDSHGQLVLTNEAAHRLLGLNKAPPGYFDLPLDERLAFYAPRAMDGRTLTPHVWLARHATREVDDTRESETTDVHLRTLDGRELDVSASMAPLRDLDGQIAGGVLVLNDRTAQNRLAREREEARASELALRDMNQRLDTFVAMAAHDLRRPVAVSKLRIEMAQRQVRRAAADAQRGVEHDLDFAQLEHTLEVARHSTDRLAGLMEQLLDVTRARQGTLALNCKLCDLVALVRGCVDEQRLLTPERVLTLDLSGEDGPLDSPDQPIMVDADANRVSQALINYLTNAERYSPEDQPIEVTLCVLEQATEQATEQAPQHVARVSVRDHGAGIPPEAQTLIWDRFQSAHDVREAQGGLGLGLYIARMIIELHGGQVGVESAVGKGSTFWFTIPLAPTAR